MTNSLENSAVINDSFFDQGSVKLYSSESTSSIQAFNNIHYKLAGYKEGTIPCTTRNIGEDLSAFAGSIDRSWTDHTGSNGKPGLYPLH